MFYYVSGTVAHVEPYLAVIDCGGVGYACRTTNQSLSRLTAGEKGKLFTHLYVREEIFELLRLCHGGRAQLLPAAYRRVGRGAEGRALHPVSATTPEGLAMSIITGDEKALTVAQGIGKKIAQRIILELKDKLAKGQIAPKGESYGGTGVTVHPAEQVQRGGRRPGRAGIQPERGVPGPSGRRCGSPQPGGHRQAGPEEDGRNDVGLKIRLRNGSFLLHALC